MTVSQILGLLPQLILLLTGLLVLALDLIWGEEKQRWLPYVALLGLAGTLVVTVNLWAGTLFTVALLGEPLFEGVFAVDSFAIFFQLIAVLATGLVILTSIGYFEGRTPYKGEFYSLLLFAALAITLMAAATDLIMVYISIEMLSITSYVLTGFLRGDRKSNEAALKYFLYGAAASAAMLYGMSFLYGTTGSTDLAQIATALSGDALGSLSWVVRSAMVLLLVGFGFKVSAVPFHQWAPDVYEGAPTPFTAFLSVGSKAAGFAVLLRVFLTALPGLSVDWVALVAALSIVTMTLGNLVAIFQKNIKRMLAYSSIAQAGYILIGLVCWKTSGEPGGISGVLFYLLAYLFTNMGAFAVIIAVERATGSNEISDYAGLMRRNPWLAVALLIFFLSLVGIPPTGGFLGKLLIFSAAIRLQYYALAIIGVINGVISLYYYFGVLRRAFFLPPEDETPIVVSPSLGVALAVTLAMTVGIVIFAQPFIQLAIESASSL